MPGSLLAVALETRTVYLRKPRFYGHCDVSSGETLPVPVSPWQHNCVVHRGNIGILNDFLNYIVAKNGSASVGQDADNGVSLRVLTPDFLMLITRSSMFTGLVERWAPYFMALTAVGISLSPVITMMQDSYVLWLSYPLYGIAIRKLQIRESIKVSDDINDFASLRHFAVSIENLLPYTWCSQKCALIIPQ